MQHTEMLESLIVLAVAIFVFLFTLSLILGFLMKLSLKILSMVAYPTYLGLYMLEDIIESQITFSNKRFFKLYKPKDWFPKAFMDIVVGISSIVFIFVILDIFRKIEKRNIPLSDNFKLYAFYGALILMIYIFGHFFGEKEDKSGMNKLLNMKSIKEEE